MALEKALWTRLKNAGAELILQGHRLHMERLENLIGTGVPDVDGCLDGVGFWIELKSEARPKRADTLIRPKLRESQSIWHRERAWAGCRLHWTLLQVGHAHAARLYLVPGDRYDDIAAATEAELTELSVVPPVATVAEVLARCVQGW